MKYAKNSFAVVAGLLLLGACTFARNPSDTKTEEDRLQNAGKVMQEILNVPDNIPQDLLDKARCVVVMPSVLKAAFVVGGSYGRGASSLLHSKVKLGADASIAAGPKGRSAAADTDAFMRAEILSYSRARGVFAGVSLEGSTLRPDNEANHKLYGESTDAQKIIDGQARAVPPAAHDLVATLKKSSPQLSH